MKTKGVLSVAAGVLLVSFVIAVSMWFDSRRLAERLKNAPPPAVYSEPAQDTDQILKEAVQALRDSNKRCWENNKVIIKNCQEMLDEVQLDLDNCRSEE